MNCDRIEGKWQQVTGKAKERWGRLTDGELSVVARPSRPTPKEDIDTIKARLAKAQYFMVEALELQVDEQLRQPRR